MSKIQNIKRIIVSRPDAIGDVVLTLPVCGLLKKHMPGVHITFLGKTYTKDIIACCEHVDEFINADELLNAPKDKAAEQLKKINADAVLLVFPNKYIAGIAKDAGIPLRIGTTNRLFHWGTVNKFVLLSRKKSDLHESQLNCRLLGGLGIDDVPSLNEIHKYIGFTKIPALPSDFLSLIDTSKVNIILHPKSNASAREWSLSNYKNLIELLPGEQYHFFISGSEKEKTLLSEWIKTLPASVTDITGKLSLSEFISFISNVDFLVAASTGPLHIASACGINAIGIYPPIKPMHPGRWQPIGKNATFLCKEVNCNTCKHSPADCACMNDIHAKQVVEIITARHAS